MRFFKGDGPSCQFEAGQQKGGHYFCWICGIVAYRTRDYAHAAYRKWLSFADRQEKVLRTENSRDKSRKGFVKLYSNLNKAEVLDELDEREVPYKSYDDLKTLRDKLTAEMHGIQRVSSLLFNCPEEDLVTLGLQLYEILATEPLHEMENQIKNLFEEILSIG